MKLVRTWPRHIPPGRTGYVVDALERLEVDQYDLRAVADLDDDILMLEWDLAVDKAELLDFADLAAATPQQVLVAPYRIYPEGNPGQQQPEWVHRRFDVGAAQPGRWIQVRSDNCRPVADGEPTCHLFGVGLSYLPKWLLRGYCDDYLARNPQAALNDHLLSLWHFHHADDPEVPICWQLRPVHLHYTTKGLVQ
jgi:hypothetical protein